MRELVGLQPTALLAIRFSPQFEGTRRSETGYFHSVVLHPDGMAEDSWGKGSVAEIASRFGVTEFKISREEHQRVVEKVRHSSADLYDSAFKDAVDLIQAHRLRQ